MANTGGLMSGLVVGGDTTLIPPQVRALMAKRRSESNDNTPRINMIEEIKAASLGKKGLTPQQTDSLAKQFNHDEYIKHLDSLGYEVVKKK